MLAPAASERGHRLLLIAVSLLAALFLIELPALFHFLDYAKLIGPAAGDVFAATNRGDPELMHLHPPHSHFSGSALGGAAAAQWRVPAADLTMYQWEATYDANGFRNATDLQHADIAVVGDSFVEDINTPEADLMTTRLANLRHEIVANLGQYGYGPGEESAVLRRYALALHPHTVVWMFYEGNDLRDEIRYENETTRHGSSGFWRRMWDHSFTYNALAQIRFQYRRLTKASAVTRMGVLKAGGLPARDVYFVYSAGPLRPDDLKSFDETIQDLAQAEKECEAAEAQLLVVFIPAKFRAYRPYCSFPEQSQCARWSLDDLPQRFQQTLQSAAPGTAFLDLTSDLMADTAAGRLPFHTDDDHWTAEGHRVAAVAINAALGLAHQ